MDIYINRLLPQELKDNVLLHFGSFTLAAKLERYWVASQLYNDKTVSLSKETLERLIPFLSVEKKGLVFLDAAKHGYLDIVNHLLGGGGHKLSSDNYPEALKLASTNGHQQVVKLLLAVSHSDPSNYTRNVAIYTAIWTASANGHDLVVKHFFYTE